MIEFIIGWLIVGFLLNVLIAVPYLRSDEYRVDWLRLIMWSAVWPLTLWMYIRGPK